MKKILIALIVLLLVVTGCEESVDDEVYKKEVIAVQNSALIFMYGIVEGDYTKAEDIIFWGNLREKDEDKVRAFNFLSQMTMLKFLNSGNVELDGVRAVSVSPEIKVYISKVEFNEKMDKSRVEYQLTSGSAKVTVEKVILIKDGDVWKVSYPESISRLM